MASSIASLLAVGGPARSPWPWPRSEVALLGAIEAAREGLIDPILVGPHHALEGLAERLGVDLAPHRVIDARDDVDAAAKAVRLCR
jgi:phosphate acetyltransferase